ncbi:unnamed protein product [Owenia fusiformis]|uniref:Uncharacterized protein n=1 Tax=Owenia fusiformis TaxID=6347 RepID=A0A8S4Q8X4_OWEFU|nr:unnamed protein product [Owenia fusiformis]
MSGECFGGYYCTSSVTMPNPSNDGTTGEICPREEFCPNGTAAPQLCQAGYYLNSTGNDDVSDCELRAFVVLVVGMMPQLAFVLLYNSILGVKMMIPLLGITARKVNGSYEETLIL